MISVRSPHAHGPDILVTNPHPDIKDSAPRQYLALTVDEAETLAQNLLLAVKRYYLIHTDRDESNP